jgi:pyroglutamyl-peptidase
VGDVRFVGEVLPVSYRRAPEQTLRLVAAHKADAVLGTGVSGRATGPVVERVGRQHAVGRVDVEGQALTLLEGPAEVGATWSPEALAEALGAELSDDAGRYVCNAWLYKVASRATVPVAFLHVPPGGIDADRVAAVVAPVA